MYMHVRISISARTMYMYIRMHTAMWQTAYINLLECAKGLHFSAMYNAHCTCTSTCILVLYIQFMYAPVDVCVCVCVCCRG